MPTIGVNTRVTATPYRSPTRYPSVRTRQAGATGPSTPLPNGGLVTYAAGVVTFDPLAPRNALDDGTAITTTGISELGDPFVLLDGVPDDLAADVAITSLTAGRVLAFTPQEA